VAEDVGIINGDCVDFMRRRTEADGGPWADLVFADPPFNVNYEYDVYKDNLPIHEYVEWTRRWMAECHAALKPDGSFWFAAPDEYEHRLKVVAEECGFHMRNHVVWHYSFGVNSARKFTRSHAHLLYYVKNPKDFCWNGDDVKVPSWRQLNGDKRAKDGGKHPDDTWQFKRICGTHKERQGWHKCQMPKTVLDRIIRVSSDPGDLVLDPFLGSGTTAVAALSLGRNVVGIELSTNYADKARQRVDAAAKEAARG
jgi:site-specific DNA-methyltransferase (adenine-specific)